MKKKFFCTISLFDINTGIQYWSLDLKDIFEEAIADMTIFQHGMVVTFL